MNYRVMCYEPGCGKDALYKVAARWSDGVTEELKTYSLSCESCLAKHFLDSLQRHQITKLQAHEQSEPPGIYQLSLDRRDRSRAKLPEKEREILRNRPHREEPA